MALVSEARRTLLGWKVDCLIMAASNQVINIFITNALQNQKPVNPNTINNLKKSISIRILDSREDYLKITVINDVIF